jgi:hypothetical protein
MTFYSIEVILITAMKPTQSCLNPGWKQRILTSISLTMIIFMSKGDTREIANKGGCVVRSALAVFVPHPIIRTRICSCLCVASAM